MDSGSITAAFSATEGRRVSIVMNRIKWIKESTLTKIKTHTIININFSCRQFPDSGDDRMAGT